MYRINQQENSNPLKQQPFEKWNKAHFNINIVKSNRDPLPPRELDWKYVELKGLWQIDVTKLYPIKKENDTSRSLLLFLEFLSEFTKQDSDNVSSTNEKLV